MDSTFIPEPDSDGTTDGEEFQIGLNELGAYYQEGLKYFNSSVSPLADGGFVVTWESGSGMNVESTIFGQRFDSDGITQGLFRVSSPTSGAQHSHSVTSLPDGGFVLAWEAYSENDSDIFGIRYGTDGKPKGSEFQINTLYSGYQHRPSIKALADGAFGVTWTSSQNYGHYQDIFGHRFSTIASVITEENATKALAFLDNGISIINTLRSTYGATINRLEYAVDNLTNIAQNTEAARSRILDTDYAKETTELARTQITQQAAMAMLTQANQQTEQILELLKSVD